MDRTELFTRFLSESEKAMDVLNRFQNIAEEEYERDNDSFEKKYARDFLMDTYVKLRIIWDDLDYFQRGISDEGIISVNEFGDYVVGNTELDIGDDVEIFLPDNYYGRPGWQHGMIAYNEIIDRYYFVEDPFLDLEGLRGRIRKPSS